MVPFCCRWQVADGKSHIGTTVLRWVARVLSLASIAFVLVFIIGEGCNPATFAPRELALFVFFPVGLCVGLVAAWFTELIGGVVVVVSFAGFYGVHLAASGAWPRGPWFAVLALPGPLFVVCGILRRREPSG